MSRLLIFSDLDGTFLHPRTYDFSPALPALRAAAARGVPVMFCSSKTRSEIEELRRRCGNTDPFVAENGGAIFIPEDSPAGRAEDSPEGAYLVVALGRPYPELRRALRELRDRLQAGVTGFGDLTREEVCRLTDLPPAQAALALRREYDEPFFFSPGETGTERFLRAIEERGLRWTRGGRFHHLHGDNDKGRAVRILRERYEALSPGSVSIGLGDSLNDLPLLEAVDRPVLIPREDGSYDEEVALPNLLRAQGAGPAGWNRAVLGMLDS